MATCKNKIIWSGRFYFANGKLIDHISLGHGKSKVDTWKPGQVMLTDFDESKKDIARYQGKKTVAKSLLLHVAEEQFEH